MSEHQQAPQADRRSPIRKATATRPSSSGPGDRIASARDVAIYFREDCRPLQDSLQLEMVAAQYHLRMRDVRSPEGVPVGDATSAGVVAELEGHGDALSHAILRALGDVATGETAVRSAEAVARLAERGIGLPVAFADAGDARPVGAWRETEGARPGEYVLFAEFEHPLGRRHVLALFVEPRRGGVVKHIGLMDPAAAFAPDSPFRPATMEALEPPSAGALLRGVLDRSLGPGLPGADDYRLLIAAARARAMEEKGAAPLAA